MKQISLGSSYKGYEIQPQEEALNIESVGFVAKDGMINGTLSVKLNL